jgi:hypothetical protein
MLVIPAKAGIHLDLRGREKMDSGFRRNDEQRSDALTRQIGGLSP